MPTMEPSGTQGPSQPAEIPAVEYIKAARTHIRNGRRREAYGILLQADAIYPDHPIILSYLGWLQAVVDKKYKGGIAACRRAFVLFKTSDPQSAGRIYPVLYHNLGMTFLAAGRKKEAVESFQKGLRYDRHHGELKKEMKLLGTRKKPPIAFLSRSNPLTMIIGKLFHPDPEQARASR
ncbi:MAG: tetratricopeptide repeat protein [Nitrospirota bacterium]